MQAPAVVRGGVVAVGVAAMVLVPITALDDQRPAFLGWHMYANNHAAIEVEVELVDGTTEEVELSSVAARIRPEVDYREATAEWICEARPDVSTVRLTREFPDMDWKQACSAS